ncbi:hydrogenase maturation protease [Desulfotomaculum copahuensis]|nr:hydrogenase maturation protease [Desulfotomaculum copahuensis]
MIKYDVLVLGLGNILMSDDGLGIRVVEKLKEKKWPSGALILEAGTALISCLAEISHSRHAIAVDAVRAGGISGTIYRLTDEELIRSAYGEQDGHGFSLPAAIELARSLTGFPDSLVIYGVEPQDVKPGLLISPPVERALPVVTGAITEEIFKLTIK